MSIRLYLANIAYLSYAAVKTAAMTGNVNSESNVETKISFDAKAESLPYLWDSIAVTVAAGIAVDNTDTPVTTGSTPRSFRTMKTKAGIAKSRMKE